MTVALALAKVAKTRGLVLLIGADAVALASNGGSGGGSSARAGHGGVRAAGCARAIPRWIITIAAHSPVCSGEARRPNGADAALYSADLPQPQRIGRTHRVGPRSDCGLALNGVKGLPVIAIGGVSVNTSTAARLIGTGVCRDSLRWTTFSDPAKRD